MESKVKLGQVQLNRNGLWVLFKNLEWMDYWTAVYGAVTITGGSDQGRELLYHKAHGAGGSGKLSEPRAGKSIPGEKMTERSISDMGSKSACACGVLFGD